MSLFSSLIAQPPSDLSTFKVSSGYVQFTGAQSRASWYTSEYVAHFYRERIKYHDGKTYFVIPTPYQVKPYQQAHLLVYDKDQGFDRPYTCGKVNTASDTHNVPVVDIGNDRINILQEDTHNTPLKQFVSGTSGFDYSIFSSSIANVGTKLAYPHLIKLPNGNHAIWCRQGFIGDTLGTWYGMYWTEFTNGMLSAGTPRQITEKPLPLDTVDFRHYPSLPFGRCIANDEIFVGWTARKDLASTHYRQHAARTPVNDAQRGIVFTNIEGTYTHNVVTDGPITDAECAAHFAYANMVDTDIQGGYGVMAISPEGKFFSIVMNPTDRKNYLKYYESGAWVVKPLTIGVSGTAINTIIAPMYLIVLNDNDIRYVDRFNHGSFQKPHWVRSRDKGTTWEDLGDMNPEITDRSLRCLIPGNILDIPPNTNFPIYFPYDDNANTIYTAGFICRTMAWGNLQPTPGVTVTPASSMAYLSNNMFHYKAVAADITVSGSDVVTLVDKFGVRNATTSATASERPKFDGVDTITVNLPSLANQRFIVGTPASLCSMGAFTFIAVAKRGSGECPLLCLTLNSQSAKHISIELNNVLQYRHADTGTSVVFGSDSVADNNFHVIAVTCNNAHTVNMYVDGKKQFFAGTNMTDASNILTWQEHGEGPQFITGLNQVNLGLKDISTTDVYGQYSFKEKILYNVVLPQAELQARIKRLCNDYGITYQNSFQIPTT
jgi:hypothetical protein